MPFATTWMDLEIIILSEVIQREKDKYDITYMWTLKIRYKNSFTNSNRLTDIENKLVATKG